MWLGLTASLLAGGAVRLPQLLPGPGQPGKNRNLTALNVFACYIPLTERRAMSSFCVHKAPFNSGCLGLGVRIL